MEEKRSKKSDDKKSKKTVEKHPKKDDKKSKNVDKRPTLKALIHRYANEAQNIIGPQKTHAQYVESFCNVLERNHHSFEKEKRLKLPPEDAKRLMKREEERAKCFQPSKRKSKAKTDHVKEAFVDKEDGIKKKKKGKKEEDNKTKKKGDPEKENFDAPVVPDLIITDPKARCIVDIKVKEHMERGDKLKGEKCESILKFPAFVINFGKKTGPVVKHWKTIKKLKNT